ncbi:MAG: ATP-binding protein [Chloroflexota bacterium]|nr:ATP-binding protein [Chloroflexota bacterium]
MSAYDFLWLVTQAVFLVVFLDVAIQAFGGRDLARLDIALFFGIIVALIGLGDLGRLDPLTRVPVVESTSLALVSLLAYVLVRIVDDFGPRQSWIMVGAAAGTVLLIVAAFVFPHPTPIWFSALSVAWFVALGGYGSIAFARLATRSRGVTQRRMQAVAIGSGLVALAFVLAIVGILAPAYEPSLQIGTQLFGLAAGVAYFIGFSTPATLRRAWQEPELRSFLGRAASLPRLPTTDAIVTELERGAAESTGAPSATVGLFDRHRNKLRYHERSGAVFETEPDALIGGKIFTEGRPFFTADARRTDPANAQLYDQRNATAVVGAPIAADGRSLGVLLVYARRAPIFAEDDLSLVKLLADQAAVILESRTLIEEAARVEAREEATRLKDDFLSAAAHDLRTPLTTLLLHAELLQRRAEEDPTAPLEMHRVASMVTEAHRLQALVTSFLDASRAERGQLVDHRETVDLVPLVEDVCSRIAGTGHLCRAEASGPILGHYDADRVRQLIDNLVENAVKYSPAGGEVLVRAWREDDAAHISVSDHGIGIPPADLPNLFNRFHRGSNVDDRRFQGLGLGLFICRAIVEDHDGEISATSEVGEGSTFHVVLPALPASGRGLDHPLQAADLERGTVEPISSEAAGSGANA